MRIAVNMAPMPSGEQNTQRGFVFAIFKHLAHSFPEHQFILLFDKDADKSLALLPNVDAVTMGSPGRNPLLWKFWLDIRIPAALKRCRADVFVSTGWCSLAARIPQCLLVPDLNYLHGSVDMGKSHLLFYRRNVSKFFHKAKSIAATAEFSKKRIRDEYNIEADKVMVIYSTAREIFQPASPEIRRTVRNTYSGGWEFFLYTGDTDDTQHLISLLKAFSVFKKRQKSNMKLVLAGRSGKKYASFTEKLKTYKHREDVILLGDLNDEQLAKVTTSAYALVQPFLANPGVSVFEAIQCHVPLITAQPAEELANGAALYADMQSFEDVADKMMLIYKDEDLRKELIEKEKTIAPKYSLQRTAELLWQTILKAVN